MAEAETGGCVFHGDEAAGRPGRESRLYQRQRGLDPAPLRRGRAFIGRGEDFVGNTVLFEFG